MHSEVADATGNVKYNRSSLWTSPSSVLVTGVLLKASQMVLVFVTLRTFHCVMHEVKLVPKPATIYVSSKARHLQLFQMFAEVVASPSFISVGRFFTHNCPTSQGFSPVRVLHDARLPGLFPPQLS